MLRTVLDPTVDHSLQYIDDNSITLFVSRRIEYNMILWIFYVCVAEERYSVVIFEIFPSNRRTCVLFFLPRNRIKIISELQRVHVLLLRIVYAFVLL